MNTEFYEQKISMSENSEFYMKLPNDPYKNTWHLNELTGKKTRLLYKL